MIGLFQDQMMVPDMMSLFEQDHVPLDLQLVQNFRRILEIKFRKIRNPAFYSRALGISTWRLNFLTTRHLHKTVYELIQERRTIEAIKLLKYTTLSVKEISYELGFNDPPYFIRYFKKLTGDTPRCFRTKIRQYE